MGLERKRSKVLCGPYEYIYIRSIYILCTILSIFLIMCINSMYNIHVFIDVCTYIWSILFRFKYVCLVTLYVYTTSPSVRSAVVVSVVKLENGA